MFKLKLKQLVAKILTRFTLVGTEYVAYWSASSSNQNNQRVTDSLTLPAGTYFMFFKAPMCSQSALFFQIYYDGADDYHYPTASAVPGQGQSTFACLVKLDSQKTVYARTNFSTQTTYTYLERGWIRAVRIA